MRKRFYLLLAATAISSVSLTGCGGEDEQKEDAYSGDGKLAISLRNLYFDDYQGGDSYIQEIERKFGVSLSFESYSWSQWEQQVSGQINGGNLPDVFHANIDSYNFALTYKFWAEEEIIKPLPSNLSYWPNIQKMILNTSNIQSLYVNGQLYGLPIAKSTTDYSTTFSPFTYIYRRDWAKQFGVYQENDEYTWEQFINLLNVFSTQLASSNRYALGDVEWGYPSIINFYKQVPHCFAYNEVTKQYVNNYTTPLYLQGLEMAKNFRNWGFYYPSQNSAADGQLNKEYYGNKIGVLYENLSYSNYETLKTMLKRSNSSNPYFNVDDATAIMKIKGPDGKYALEGTDNWFSMTFFDNRISDTKMYKILSILDWLLSEEGTRFSIYGFEDYDYIINDEGEIELVEAYWPKADDGSYAPKRNGAKYLRYLASLGYDTLSYDPLTNKESVEYLESWENEMKAALDRDELKVLKERPQVMWLTTQLKSQLSGLMRTTALNNVMKYVYGEISTLDEFCGKFGYPWPDVLAEINGAIGGY